jgi:sugar phosphate permease
MATELSHKRATGTALGLLGAFSGLGASIAGYPLSTVTQHYGWQYYGYAVTLASIISTMLLVPLWSITKAKQE